MGQESAAWVLGYIAAFGLSDTLVAMCTTNPAHPCLLVYYGVMGLVSLGLFRRSVHAKDVLGAHAHGLDVGPHTAQGGPDHAEAVPGLRAEEDGRWNLRHHVASEPCAPQVTKKKVLDQAPHVGR